MMMGDDKKNRATVIMAKLSGSKEQPEKRESNEMGDEVDKSIPLDSAAEEILAAVESKDASALREALKSFYEMCDSEAE